MRSGRRTWLVGVRQRTGAAGRRFRGAGNLVFGGCLLLAFVGFDIGPVQAVSDPAGFGWSQVSPATSPAARALSSSTYDPATNSVVVFGGQNLTHFFNDTWSWDGSRWTQVGDSTDPGCTTSCAGAPSARNGATMVFDPASGDVVLFGGSNGGDLGDTWTWDGTSWTEQFPGSSPPARALASMAYDSATGNVVLFGGAGSPGELNDTWMWDGSTWTQVADSGDPGCTTTCTASPPARRTAMIAYDAARANVVLFGGLKSGTGELNDTWLWDDNTWAQMAPGDPGCTTACTASPPARDSGQLAFDPSSGNTVLFGGFDGTGYLNDTWVWGGSGWMQVADSGDFGCTTACAASPSARANAVMAYDPAEGNVMLFGGDNASGGFPGSGFLADTWTWSGPTVGVVYYVTTHGGTPTCTAAGNDPVEPFNTVQAALDCSAGDSTTPSSPDTIDVAPGTYDEHDTVTANVNIIGTGAPTSTFLDGTSSGTVLTVGSSDTVTVTGLTIENGSGPNAGGIFDNGGTVTVNADNLLDNSSASGPCAAGGILITSGGAVTATGDTFAGNTVCAAGGAIHNGGGATLTSADNTFVDNSGSGGGGIWNQGTMTSTNDTFTGNSAGNYGGAIETGFGGTVSVTNDTFSDNTGGTGDGGGVAEFDGSGGSIAVANSVLANNTGGNCGPGVTDGGHNISYPASDASCPNTFGSGNPDLGPLQNNGSESGGAPTDTIAITPVSSAFELVPPADCPVHTDERGYPRPGVPNHNCDAGAFEYQAPAITSPSSATFTAGEFSGFTVTTASGDGGIPSLTEIGTVPTGISFNDNGDGTASLSGAPASGTSGTYPVTITATDANSVAVSQNFTLFVVLSWTTPQPIDPAFQPRSVSCPSTKFCAAVDAEGRALTFNGKTWSAPTNIDSPAFPGPVGGINSISCPSSSFCMAVDGAGNALRFVGGTWSTPVGIDSGNVLDSVSCPSSSFCVAVDAAGSALTYNGSGWTPSSIDSGNFLDTVSCPTSSFCVAGDGAGKALIYNGSSWTTQVVTSFGITSVSCPSASFCMATDGGPTGVSVFVFNGTSWSLSAQLGLNLGPVSCTSASFCVVSGVPSPDFVEVWTFNGKKWSAPTNLEPLSPPFIFGDSISCATALFCMDVDDLGRALSFNGNSWSTPGVIDGSGGLSSVSCPSASFCSAVDQNGNALTFNGSTWSTPTPIDSPGAILDWISCPSSTFCTAVDKAGNAITFNGKRWTAPAGIDSKGGGITSVSCPSASFCVAVDNHGNALTFNGKAWSPPKLIDHFYSTTSPIFGMQVSCPSASFCAAVDGEGDAMTFSAGTWKTALTVETGSPYPPAGNGFQSVSCQSATFCVAADEAGNTATFDGSTWHTPTTMGLGNNGDFTNPYISCASTSFCVVAIDNPGVRLLVGNGSTWTAPQWIDNLGWPTGYVSCPTTSFCAAVDLAGNALLGRG